jgi:hypothetical protein
MKYLREIVFVTLLVAFVTLCLVVTGGRVGRLSCESPICSLGEVEFQLLIQEELNPLTPGLVGSNPTYALGNVISMSPRIRKVIFARPRPPFVNVSNY